MWMQGGHPAVAVSLDGRAEPLRFVVDSAAGATLVDDRVVRRYGLGMRMQRYHRPKGQVQPPRGCSAYAERPGSWAVGSCRPKP